MGYPSSVRKGGCAWIKENVADASISGIVIAVMLSRS
jgi:hypothetical protein